MVSAVVFDMDGVLFDTERLLCEQWTAVGSKHGIPDMEATLLSCVGRSHKDSRQFFWEKYGDSVDYEKFFQEAVGCFYAKIKEEGLPVKKGAYELLEYLKQEGYPIALASSSRMESIQGHLSNAGMLHYFKAIIGGDMVEHSKPHPEIYERACQMLGQSTEHCIAIEDSPNGIRSAYQAGMQPVMVPDMIQPDEVIQAMLHLRFDSLLEVQAYLQSLKQD